MRMHTLDRRVHLLLDANRYRKVSNEARRRQVSVATVIRDAIDRLPADDDRVADAVERILAAAPMPVPADPRALRQELDEARRRGR
jgi:hypothetical protein